MTVHGSHGDQVMDVALRCGPAWTDDHVRRVTALASRLGFIAIHLPSGVAAAYQHALVEELVNSGSDLMIVTDSIDAGLEAANPNVVHGFDLDQVRQVRARLDSGDDASPLIVELPLSIGRTRNEAVARADLEPLFAGEQHPEQSGIFGTFEEAQVQVMDLARAGAEVLLISVPYSEDIADLLAQVRALFVGPSVNLVSQP